MPYPSPLCHPLPYPFPMMHISHTMTHILLKLFQLLEIWVHAIICLGTGRNHAEILLSMLACFDLARRVS